jgi:hypothetical protein
MELIGQAIFTIIAITISVGLAFVSRFFRPLRKFSLAFLTTPPVAVFSFFICGWGINDSGTVCGPNPEWDRCPSVGARVLGWSAWLGIVLAVAAGSFWIQRRAESVRGLFEERHPFRLFGKRPEE